MKPSCRDVCEQATLLLEAGSTGPECEVLREHLSRCPACGEYVRQLGVTVEALKQVPEGCTEQAKTELLKCYEAWLGERRGR